MLVSRLAVAKPFHEILPFHINSTDTIDNDMDMNVAGTVMPINVGADQCLMPRKVL